MFWYKHIDLGDTISVRGGTKWTTVLFVSANADNYGWLYGK